MRERGRGKKRDREGIRKRTENKGRGKKKDRERNERRRKTRVREGAKAAADKPRA